MAVSGADRRFSSNNYQTTTSGQVLAATFSSSSAAAIKAPPVRTGLNQCLRTLLEMVDSHPVTLCRAVTNALLAATLRRIGATTDRSHHPGASVMGTSPERLEQDQVENVQANNYISTLAVAWRHKSLIILTGVVGIAIGTLYYYQQPAIYSSSAQLIVIKKGNILNGSDDGRYYNDWLSEHQLIIKSPILVKFAVDDERLAELPRFQNNRDASGAILGSLSVARGPRKDAVRTVTCRSFVRQYRSRCPLVLNAIIETYQTGSTKI